VAYERGEGAPLDRARARTLYASACGLGDATACSHLKGGAALY
jgi:hypothetical protein